MQAGAQRDHQVVDPGLVRAGVAGVRAILAALAPTTRLIRFQALLTPVMGT